MDEGNDSSCAKSRNGNVNCCSLYTVFQLDFSVNMSAEQVIPPVSHIVQPDDLQVGDQIYRRLKGIRALFGYHHGVVSKINKGRTVDGIEVIEMTRNGIGTRSLSDFLDGYDCRLVYYNVPNRYQTFHANGTGHVEEASPVSKVKKRIKFVLDNLKNEKEMYALLGANCEEFAVWIKTGLYKGVKMSQLKGAKEAINNLSRMTSALAKLTNYADDIALSVGSSSAAKNVATEAVENGTSKSVTASALSTARYTAGGILGGIGVAMAIEAVCTGYKVWKYKKCQKCL